MIRSRFLVPVLALAAACNLDTEDRINQPPKLRVVNAAQTTAPVNLHLNTNTVGLLADPLEFEEVTPDCLLILEATHQLSFVQGGTVLAQVTHAFAENASYVVVLVENAGTFKAVVVADDATAPSGSNGLRFINATATAGDVHVTSPGEAPAASTLAAGNLASLATANNPSLPYIFRSETATNVRLFDAGTTATARSNVTLAGTGPRRLTNVIFTPPTFAADPGAIQVNACS